jgi:hypothetical protein
VVPIRNQGVRLLRLQKRRRQRAVLRTLEMRKLLRGPGADPITGVKVTITGQAL